MKRIIIPIGQRFGRLVVESMRGSKWLCKCDCGNITEVGASQLLSGGTKSCGCYNRDCRMTHGASKTQDMPHGTLAYRAWATMKGRCYRVKNASYLSYGGRGIKVCERWRDSFANFLDDMGEPLKGQRLDRINNDGDYEPSNCMWVSPKENSRNTRSNVCLTFKGKTQCLAAWAEEYGINYSTFFSRLSSGWSLEKILTTPVRRESRD